jgi:NAD(P)-dependent dehydrogenase (short-subunit alcohol dehydrogenase family)
MPKTILITGSTHGIGEAAAKDLAAQGHQVIIHGRSATRCQEVIEQIKHQTGNANLTYFTADLSEMSQVRQLARQVKERFTRLDVLINNAGNFFLTHQKSPDGYEMTWAVNHLSYYVLTLHLLDLLKASAPARIVNVSSNSHFGARLDCDPLTGLEKRLYLSWKAYGRSKLANVLFTYELHRRFDDLGITANALHPGLVRTHIWDKFGFLSQWVIRFYLSNRSLTSEEGAQTSVYLAASPEVEGVSGKYFYRCQTVDSSRESYNVDEARRLWEAGKLLLNSE